MSTSKTLRVLTVIGLAAPFLAACSPREVAPEVAFCVKTGSNDFQILRNIPDSGEVEVIHVANDLKYNSDNHTFSGDYESIKDPENAFGKPVNFTANESDGRCTTLRTGGPESNGMPAYVEYRLSSPAASFTP